ncbi:MAG: hypothetical protein WBW32_14160 [Luteibacter sp.]
MRASTRIIGVRLVQAIAGLLVTYILAAIAITHYQGRVQEEIRLGASEQSVVSSFWFTPGVEVATSPDPAAGRAFTTADSRCKAPCVRRLWWIHPLLPDIEAWTVDLDGDGKVIKTYHWSSP